MFSRENIGGLRIYAESWRIDQQSPSVLPLQFFTVRYLVVIFLHGYSLDSYNNKDIQSLKLTYGKQRKFGVVKLHNYQFGIIKFGKLYLKYKQTLDKIRLRMSKVW